jgi:hypothetical protein
MNYLVHATPVHPSLCLQYLILLFTIDTVTVFTLLLLLLFYYCHYYKTVATDKLLRASLFPGAAELTTHLSRLINILWLPLCRNNKFGFYFPQRLLRSPVLVGHQAASKQASSGREYLVVDGEGGLASARWSAKWAPTAHWRGWAGTATGKQGRRRLGVDLLSWAALAMAKWGCGGSGPVMEMGNGTDNHHHGGTAPAWHRGGSNGLTSWE